MRFLVLLVIIICFESCKQTSQSLPILGNAIISGKDTVFPTVAEFSFVDQDSNTVNNRTFENKIYIADFIFLSCPTICPKMTTEMVTTYKAFVDDERVVFISHTIDPEHDSIPKLKAYAESLGVNALKWHFVTGNQDSIFKLSEQSYYSAAFPDSTSPGGFTHSGGLLLVDRNKHIRGVYNGTLPSETKRLVADIQILLREQF